MKDKKIIEKKEISAKTSIKAIITGFVAYGIIGLFLCVFFSLFVQVLISNNNNLTLTITIPVIESFFLYHIIHGICRLSTYDVFRKCKTNPDNINYICKKMNLFFIICIFIFVLSTIFFLIMKLDNLYSQIQLSELQYKQVFSDNFTNQLISDDYQKYDTQKTHLIISTIIIELGLVISIFSLIPYQKKMLNEYNKF